MGEIKYHSSNNIVYSCKYHIVFCPKYRRKVLVNGVDTRLKELIKSICEEIQVDVIEMEIMPDHVHLLLEVHPQFGIHKAVKTIKGKTSRILRQEFHHLTTKLPSLWTNSCFCSTVGGAPLDIVKEALINSAAPSQRIFFARFLSANPPHSFGYASGLPPQSDRKIYANLTDFILSAIPKAIYRKPKNLAKEVTVWNHIRWASSSEYIRTRCSRI